MAGGCASVTRHQANIYKSSSNKDIKPDNVLTDRGNIPSTDFDLSRDRAGGPRSEIFAIALLGALSAELIRKKKSHVIFLATGKPYEETMGAGHGSRVRFSLSNTAERAVNSVHRNEKSGQILQLMAGSAMESIIRLPLNNRVDKVVSSTAFLGNDKITQRDFLKIQYRNNSPPYSEVVKGLEAGK